MLVIHARNAHEALPIALHHLHVDGVKRSSRNGDVLQYPEPVATVYSSPRERVVFHPWRDANPFFHFYESLWMLAGRNDIAPLARYVPRMAEFSDDGVTQNAAYGHRWRHAGVMYGESYDQLKLIANALRTNKNDRQQVLQIWEAELDLVKQTKDHACNLTATFQVMPDGQLHMVVLCRSNDIVWGCYGANAVHFSVLLEYVAARAGYDMGTYTQVSVNWHGYVATAGPMMEFKSNTHDASPYEMEPVYPYPIAHKGDDFERWDLACRAFITADGRAPSDTHPTDYPVFFRDVAFPIVQAHDAYKDRLGEEKYSMALWYLEKCEASDWKLACQEWIKRRYARFRKAADGER